jgi:hypothetical protein
MPLQTQVRRIYLFLQVLHGFKGYEEELFLPTSSHNGDKQVTIRFYKLSRFKYDDNYSGREDNHHFLMQYKLNAKRRVAFL